MSLPSGSRKTTGDVPTNREIHRVDGSVKSEATAIDSILSGRKRARTRSCRFRKYGKHSRLTIPHPITENWRLGKESKAIVEVQVWCFEDGTHPYPYALLAKPTDGERRIGIKVFTFDKYEYWITEKMRKSVALAKTLFNIYEDQMAKKGAKHAKVDHKMELENPGDLASELSSPGTVVGDVEVDVEVDAEDAAEDDTENGTEKKPENHTHDDIDDDALDYIDPLNKEEVDSSEEDEAKGEEKEEDHYVALWDEMQGFVDNYNRTHRKYLAPEWRRRRVNVSFGNAGA